MIDTFATYVDTIESYFLFDCSFKMIVMMIVKIFSVITSDVLFFIAEENA